MTIEISNQAAQDLKTILSQVNVSAANPDAGHIVQSIQEVLPQLEEPIK